MKPHRLALSCLLLLALACNPTRDPDPSAWAAQTQGLAPIPTVNWQSADYPIPSDGYSLASLGAQAVLMVKNQGMYTWDGAAWNPLEARGWPRTRATGQLVAYGSGLLMFGGYDSNANAYNAETWQWDGASWSRLSAATTPPARSGQAMAVVAGKVVMYGGFSDKGTLTDTWTWDGVDWTRVSIPNSPTVNSMSMTTVGASALLVGRDTLYGTAPETWTFDGASWTKLSPATALPTQSSCQVATMGGTAYLFDGTSTWTWSGTDWVKLAPATSPAARSGGLLVTSGSSLLLFGGYISGTGTVYDTWTFDGTTWTQRWRKPVSMKGASMATLGSKVVLFRYGETWEWDGRAWNQRTPATSPPARQYAAMATLGNKVVLYGGSQGDTKTWLWDGNNWTGLTTAHSPGARQYVGMAPLGNAVVLFGGLDMSQLPLADTWRFDGVDWKQLTTTGSPAARGGYGMTAVAGKVLLFGGAHTDGVNPANTYYYGDSWLFDGSTWSYAGGGPQARYAPILAELNGKAVLNGGRNSPYSNGVYLYDTWLFDPSTRLWSQPPVTHSPTGLMEAVAATLGQTVIRWGGGVDYYYGTGGMWTVRASLAWGSDCSSAAQCETGWCVDGVCCQTPCDPSCQSCNLPGTEGRCTTVPAGEPRPGACLSCDGDGGCEEPWPDGGLPAPDGGVDGGLPEVDAGSAVDAGADAGTAVDAGSGADAGVGGSDAGGSGGDAGTRDGGGSPSDAGQTGGDAGVVTDAGTGSGGSGGLGCSVGRSGGNAWFVAFAVALPLWARRRRRS